MLLSHHLVRLHERLLLSHLSKLLLLRLKLLLLHLQLVLLHHHHQLGLVLRDLIGVHSRLGRQLHHLVAVDWLPYNLPWNAYALDHALRWLHLRLHHLLLTVRRRLLLWLQLLLRLLWHHVLLLLRDRDLHRDSLRSNVYLALV